MTKASLSVRFLIVLFIPLVLLYSGQIFSQTPTNGDCLGAIPVCQDVYIEPTIFSGAGTYPSEIPNCYANCETCCPNNCLDGEWNSAWYIFTVQQGGMLRFKIIPDNSGDDYDWAVFNLTTGRCEEIYSLVNQLQVSCNSAAFDGETGMMSSLGGSVHCNVCGTTNTNRWNADLLVLSGQSFVLYVSNWGAGATAGFTLDFSESTAVIFDDVDPVISTIGAEQVSGCSETELGIVFSENVTCEWMTPNMFTIEGPGGPYMVTDVYGPACAVGGEWEKEYTLTVDHPFTSNGTYTLYMSVGFPGVQDACGNIALADTLVFDLDLGAPLLDESGLSVADATCGMDNGSIMGLSASGQSGLTYVWKNSQGAIVGSTIDLLNIPAESYTLEIYDNQDCITYGGPYVVAEIGAPELDDNGIVITPSNYGFSTGSITGIIVTSVWTIDEYIWHDDQSNVVGNNLDLDAVPTGYYTLTVIDENTCEALAGPYFVGEIGGPLTLNPSANPDVICRGETTSLSTGAGGGIGNYSYSWSSNPSGFSSSLENPVVAPETDTRYYITIEDNGLLVTDSVDVKVHQLPVPNAGPDQSIAHGIYTFLEGSASVGSGSYHYFWTPVEKLEDATVQNPQTKNIYETTPFYLDVEDAVTGCVSEEADQVTVAITGGMLSINPKPFPDSIVCIDEIFELQAHAGGGSGLYTYQWTDTAGTVLSTEASFELSLSEAKVHYFYLKVNDGYNDIVGYVVVRVDPAPLVNLGGDIQYVCVHETITLDAGNPGSTYLWSNGDTNRYTSMGTTGLGYDEQSIAVHVTNKHGCEADASATIVFDYDFCVGLEEYVNELDARIFPNPTSGMIRLEVNDISGRIEVRIFNLLGETQYRNSFISSPEGSLKKDLDLSILPKGVYLLQVHANEGAMTTELVIH